MAQLKNTTFDSVASLDLPSGTTAQRPASPAAGMIRYNTTVSDTEYYDGAAWRSISDSNPEATGGTIVDTDIGGVAYRLHLFTNTGNTTFTVTKGGEVEYLIVAGGGGGGSRHAGGGGAGGLLTGFTTVTPQSYTVTVGAGGPSFFTPGQTIGYDGENGANSSAFGFTADGGGGGGGASSSGGNGKAGGSGGGARENTNRIGGAGTVGQGFSGGDGNTSGTWAGGGGGGGCGQAGQHGGSGGRGIPSGGNGGNGLLLNISGVNTFYAGGGGGSTYGNSTSLSLTVKNHGIGGLGGGGAGQTVRGIDGTLNTGGGGGAGSSNGDATGQGGFGGSGIVIIRYRKNASTVTSPDQVGISSLPFTSGLEDALISKTRLLVYLDANNQTSNPGTGTAWNDLSGNGYNGLLQNGPSFNNSLPKSVRFDGLNDYIQFTNPSNRWAWTPSDIGNNTLCFELWVKSTDTSGLYISRPWNGSGQYNYTLNASSLGLQAGSTSASRVFSTLATGNWEYICVILTPTQVGIYRNGYINSAFSNHGMSGGVPSSGNANQPLAVMTLYPYGGSWAGLEGFSILGEVGVFRSYNRILSPAEVLSNYDAQKLRFRS